MAINIKESKKGTFTEAAKSRGMGVQEFASKVLGNKDAYSSAMVKKANFAKNASKWKHMYGGVIAKLPDGGYLQYNAPSHAAGGQPVDANGNPTKGKNAVGEIEKRETKYKGYIFSDNLVNPETGNTIAKDHAKLMNRVKGNDSISINTRRLYSQYLQRLNESKKAEQESAMPEYGDGGRFKKQLVGPADILNYTNPINPLPARYATSVESKPTLANKDGKLPIDISYLLNKDGKIGASGIADTVADAAATAFPEIGGIMKGAAGIGSLFDLISGPNKNKPIVPNYTEADKYYQNLGVDMQGLKNEQIMAMQGANRTAAEGSSNFGQYLNRIRANAATTGRNVATTSIQGKQYNDQMSMVQGQRQDRIAEGIANEGIRTQVADLQDTAMHQDMVQNTLNKLDQFGTEFQKQAYMKQMTKDMNEADKRNFMLNFMAIGMKYGDFTWGEQAQEILKNPEKYTYEQMLNVITMRKP